MCFGKAHGVDFGTCHSWLQQQCFPSQGGSCPLQKGPRPAEGGEMERQARLDKGAPSSSSCDA